jgi:hypothetical protein
VIDKIEVWQKTKRMSILFLRVPIDMDEKVINYLIVKNLEDEDFTTNPYLRVRTAYILAKKEYLKMSAAEITQIKRELEERENERYNKEE